MFQSSVWSVARDDVLRHAVHLVGEADRIAALGPRRGEALVRHAPEEQCLGAERLVELELVTLGAALEAEGPAAPFEALGAAGILHHAVKGQELRHDQLAHRSILLRCLTL